MIKKVFIIILLLANYTFSQDSITPEREMQKGSIITGTCLFGTTWLICLMVATDGAGTLAVPVIGPFITEGMEGDNPSSPGFFVSLGLSSAEIIGIALITRGIIGKKRNHNQVLIYPHINKNEYGLKVKFNI